MANKRYYWLKLPENFFDDETIQFIEEQPNGILYSNFYLKLCLKALKNNGVLMRVIGDMYIPYDIKSLAKLTGVDVDTVRSAMALFSKIGIVKVEESGEIYITRMNEMIGSETDKAALMRKKREQDKIAAQSGNNVTQELPDCYIDNRDKSIENKNIDIRSIDNRVLDKDKDYKNNKESKPEKTKRKRFTPPTFEEVQAYINENGYVIDAERFITYYESNGWMVGRNHMKSWKATVRNWNARELSNGRSPAWHKPTAEEREQKVFDDIDKWAAGVDG